MKYLIRNYVKNCTTFEMQFIFFEKFFGKIKPFMG